MKHRFLVVACCAVGALALLDANVAAQPSADDLFADGEVIVKFKPGITLDLARRAARGVAPGATIAKSFMIRSAPTALVRVPQGSASVSALVARFQSQPNVVYAEPNYILRAPDVDPSARPKNQAPTRAAQTKVATLRGQDVLANSAAVVAAGVLPNDPFVQDGFEAIEADVIWNSTTASPVVAVLDTGVDYLHPDLAGKVVKGYDYINNDTDPMDDNGHGTHVAGIIAAKLNNKIGISGVSNGNVLAVKVLDYSGYGTHFDVAQGLYYAASNASVRVINMSLGDEPEGTALRDAVAYAVNTRGKLIVAAAGNHNTNTATYPAAYSVWNASGVNLIDKVLAVAASGAWVTGSTDGLSYFIPQCKASYSNWGTWVNITAPGTDIYSTLPYQKPFWLEDAAGLLRDYDLLSGTSMAAPHAAATAARIWSVNPSFTNVQIAQRMTGGGATPAPVVLADTTTVDIDVDSDGTVDLAFCWDPAWATQGGTSGRTLADLTETNVAFGMQRGRISGFVADASNGLPLTGAVLQAFLGTSMKGASLPVSNVDWGGYTGVNNVPWSSTPYTVKVLKSGYTTGAQAFDSVSLNGVSSLTIGEVPIPKLSTGPTFVTTMGLSTDNNLNQALLLPPDRPCEVGGSKPPDIPNITGAAYNCGRGTLMASPFARLLAESTTLMSPQVFETTATKAPLYSTTVGPYRLFLHDVIDDGSSILAQAPVTRMWQSGVVKARVDYGVNTTFQSDCSLIGAGGTANCKLWYIGDLSSTGVFTPVDQVGDGTTYAILPYGDAQALVHSLANRP